MMIRTVKLYINYKRGDFHSNSTKIASLRYLSFLYIILHGRVP